MWADHQYALYPDRPLKVTVVKYFSLTSHLFFAWAEYLRLLNHPTISSSFPSLPQTLSNPLPSSLLFLSHFSTPSHSPTLHLSNFLPPPLPFPSCLSLLSFLHPLVSLVAALSVLDRGKDPSEVVCLLGQIPPPSISSHVEHPREKACHVSRRDLPP